MKLRLILMLIGSLSLQAASHLPKKRQFDPSVRTSGLAFSRIKLCIRRIDTPRYYQVSKKLSTYRSANLNRSLDSYLARKASSRSPKN